MSRANLIQSTLEQALKPDSLDIIDESHKHAGHAGAKDGGGHFVVHIVSAAFAGKSRVARHRLINDAAQHLFANKTIHALSIDAKTPEEAA